MPENAKEFDIQKLKNDYPNFFKEFSPKFLEFILSEKTSSKITEVCIENGIKDDEKIEKTAYQITLVLLGVAPEEGLTATLKKELEIDLETANKISDETNKLIFSQIPSSEIEESPPQEKEKVKEAVMETPKLPKNDAYKEPIE